MKTSSMREICYSLKSHDHMSSMARGWIADILLEARTCRPKFDFFQLPFNELQSKTLMLTVYDYDRLSKDDKMGQLSIPLESIDFGTTTEVCRSLGKPENDDDVSGLCIISRISMCRRCIAINGVRARGGSGVLRGNSMAKVKGEGDLIKYWENDLNPGYTIHGDCSMSHSCTFFLKPQVTFFRGIPIFYPSTSQHKGSS